MSESVKIGGIGKNPAIDKINSLNAMDIKNYAANKMEQLLLTGDHSHNAAYTKKVSIDFSKVEWEGGANERKLSRVMPTENKLLRRADISGGAERLDKSIGRSNSKEISLQYKATGNIYESRGGQNIYTQHVGQAIARKPGLLSDTGDAKINKSYISGKHSEISKRT